MTRWRESLPVLRALLLTLVVTTSAPSSGRAHAEDKLFLADGMRTGRRRLLRRGLPVRRRSRSARLDLLHRPRRRAAVPHRRTPCATKYICATGRSTGPHGVDRCGHGGDSERLPSPRGGGVDMVDADGSGGQRRADGRQVPARRDGRFRKRQRMRRPTNGKARSGRKPIQWQRGPPPLAGGIRVKFLEEDHGGQPGRNGRMILTTWPRRWIRL